MKNSSKQLVVIAASLAAGAAVKFLFESNKRKRRDKYQGESWIDKCSKEKLEMIKSKIEMHKLRLENRLQKINSRLGEFEPD